MVEPASGEVLSAVELHKSFRRGRVFGGGRVTSLRGVSVDVRRGEILGLLGPSGSGKSTLARCLALLERPDRGEIRFRGRVVDWQDPRRLHALRPRIQLVFQDPIRAVNPRFTVDETLEEPRIIARRRGRPAGSKSSEELLGEVELPMTIQDRRARSLSGGQLQRLVLARALAAGPEVLILDESFSGLDLSLQARLANLLLGLVGRHDLAAVLITHDPGLADQLCDRVIRLERGRQLPGRPHGDPA